VAPDVTLEGAAATPPEIIERLQREIVRILAMPDIRKRFFDLGLDPVSGTPAEFAAVIKSEIPHWAKIIKDAGIKLSE